MDLHGICMVFLQAACCVKTTWCERNQGAPAIDLVDGSHPAAGITEESKWAPPGHCRLS